MCCMYGGRWPNAELYGSFLVGEYLTGFRVSAACHIVMPKALWQLRLLRKRLCVVHEDYMSLFDEVIWLRCEKRRYNDISFFFVQSGQSTHELGAIISVDYSDRIT